MNIKYVNHFGMKTLLMHLAEGVWFEIEPFNNPNRTFNYGLRQIKYVRRIYGSITFANVDEGCSPYMYSRDQPYKHMNGYTKYIKTECNKFPTSVHVLRRCK